MIVQMQKKFFKACSLSFFGFGVNVGMEKNFLFKTLFMLKKYRTLHSLFRDWFESI